MAKPKPNSSHGPSIGCAGWSLRKEQFDQFPLEGTHLTRYAGRFPAVEINSSFYRPHRPATYRKWAESVPAGFRFAVKVPKTLTHERRLTDPGDVLDRFLAEVGALGDKLGPLLIQLPPSLPFSASVAEGFFDALRERFDGGVALEPRHASWFGTDAERLMLRFRVARVAANPAVVEAAAVPGGWGGLVYYRWHGSPKMYYSSYPAESLKALAVTLSAAAQTADAWCVFDNTAEGAAIGNGLDVLRHFPRH